MEFEIRETPVPVPGPGEVLIRVAFCGICGSDLHLLEAGLLPPDCIIGHEFSGTVEAAGPGAPPGPAAGPQRATLGGRYFLGNLATTV